MLDLAGVALVGILGALAVTGVQAKGPGDRVSTALQFLGIQDNTLQYQATIIGLLAASLLIAKTLFSVIFIRKTIFFLSRRSAAISANLTARVLAQSLARIQSKSMQQTLYTVTAGVDSIAINVIGTTVLIISDVSLLLILGFGLFVVDPIVALSTFVVFAAIALLLNRLMQVRAVRLGEAQRHLSIESS